MARRHLNQVSRAEVSICRQVPHAGRMWVILRQSKEFLFLSIHPIMCGFPSHFNGPPTIRPSLPFEEGRLDLPFFYWVPDRDRRYQAEWRMDRLLAEREDPMKQDLVKI
ncbi:hypothetical protein CDAR_490951 [Caerostris darwini]|uniref:Uncharacterized protein n=1 Tax=Caerostris darwini TaxID=1538125 RepID=A0AAV4X7I3_9ARAC|nr:hypothetical protein CDAR_490951 [Caerostris darwini]